MSDISLTIVNLIKSWEYISIDFDQSFDCMDEYGYLYLHAIMSVENTFHFYLIGDWTNDYFNLHAWNTIDSNHDTVNAYCFNDKNWYQPLPKLDLSHVYLHQD
jgi:hypothetical protein